MLGKTYFTADMHFNHANICEYSGRPWDNVSDMNDGLVEIWNSVVTEDDTVYVVGDACMGLITESLPILDRLNGAELRLIVGNQDRPFPTFKNAEFAKLYEDYFRAINFTETLTIAGEQVELYHLPFTGDSNDHAERFVKYRPVNNGQWLMHGHIHKTHMIEDKMIHVGIDADWTSYGVGRYEPIPLSAVEALIMDTKSDLGIDVGLTKWEAMREKECV